MEIFGYMLVWAKLHGGVSGWGTPLRARWTLIKVIDSPGSQSSSVYLVFYFWAEDRKGKRLRQGHSVA